MRANYPFSAKARSYVVTALWLALCPMHTAWAASDETRAAAALFVEQQHFGNNLPSLGWIVATRTVTFAMLVQRVGQTKAESLVREQLAFYRKNYQSEWDANLASAYADHMSDVELRSLARYGSSSPFAAKLRSSQAEVGGEMQAKSSGLLKAYVTDALMAAIKEIPAAARQ